MRGRLFTLLMLALMSFAAAGGLFIPALNAILARKPNTLVLTGITFGLALLYVGGKLVLLAGQQQIEAGCCHQCEYDLMQSATRCPECGVARSDASAADAAWHRAFHRAVTNVAKGEIGLGVLVVLIVAAFPQPSMPLPRPWPAVVQLGGFFLIAVSGVLAVVRWRLPQPSSP